jgi:hypothetical protein
VSRRAVPAVLLLALALTGCGVPQDDEPRALDRSAAPFRIFERQVAPPPQGESQVEVWFLRGDQPVSITRPSPPPGSPRQVLEQLLLGPTEVELQSGLSTAIPTSLQLVDVTIAERVAVVTLDGLNEQVQVPAYAQIVASLDGHPLIDGVRFRTRDGDVQVPRGEGGLSSGAVSRDDYAVLLGLVQPEPTGPAEGETAEAPDEVPGAGG